MNPKAVTASEAEANGIELVHVSKLLGSSKLGKDGDCEVYGGYVPYSVNDQFVLNATVLGYLGITDKYTVANYDKDIVEAKTVFTPVCQTALCASCGKKLPDVVQNNLKKPVTSTTTPTAADYAEAYGDWVYTLTAETETGLTANLFGVSGLAMAKDDVMTLNFLVEKNTTSESTPKVKVYVMYYDASKGETDVNTWTVGGDATSVSFDYTGTDKVRKLSFKLPDVTGTVTTGNGYSTEAVAAATALKNASANVVLSENSEGYTMTFNSKHAYPTVANGSADYTDSLYSTSLEYDKNHTSHSFSVMKHYNVNRIEKGSKQGSGENQYGVPSGQYLGLHYEECSCGIEYVQVNHTETSTYVTNSTSNYSENSHIKCAECGYDSAKDAYFEVAVNTDKDTFMVEKDGKLSLSYTEYTPFNKKKIEIVGWSCGTGILNQSDGSFKVVSKTSTDLTYTEADD